MILILGYNKKKKKKEEQQEQQKKKNKRRRRKNYIKEAEIKEVKSIIIPVPYHPTKKKKFK